jgi:hypothetical protein
VKSSDFRWAGICLNKFRRIVSFRLWISNIDSVSLVIDRYSHPWNTNKPQSPHKSLYTTYRQRRLGIIGPLITKHSPPVNTDTEVHRNYKASQMFFHRSYISNQNHSVIPIPSIDQQWIPPSQPPFSIQHQAQPRQQQQLPLPNHNHNHRTNNTTHNTATPTLPIIPPTVTTPSKFSPSAQIDPPGIAPAAALPIPPIPIPKTTMAKTPAQTS